MDDATLPGFSVSEFPDDFVLVSLALRPLPRPDILSETHTPERV